MSHNYQDYTIIFLNQVAVLEESTRTIEYFHWQKMIVTYEKDATGNIDLSIVEATPVDLPVFDKSGYYEFARVVRASAISIAVIEANVPRGDSGTTNVGNGWHSGGEACTSMSILNEVSPDGIGIVAI
jgi:hypothetical protein